MKFDDLRENLGTFWGSVSEGWDRMRHSAAGALTRFRPGDDTRLPERQEIDDPLHFPGQSWAMLGGDVFEDEQRLVVRLEAPGMEKEDFAIEVVPTRIGWPRRRQSAICSMMAAYFSSAER